MNRKPNHLINEKSPYLLQHAYNPVNWYAWCDEAFAKARQEDKPIFLSIGYSTCHWCHVMAHESFENEEIAQLLNQYFVSIKVDREERPDLDHIYMSACQALTASGGWPLSVWLTADGIPFLAGTYFPPYNRYGHIGLANYLQAINDKWQNEREMLLITGQHLLAHLTQTQKTSSTELTTKIMDDTFTALKNCFDAIFGGFGQSPKFPMAHHLMFLLRYGQLTPSAEAIAMTEKTLSGMYRGGLFDHIGGGFSRYSTDERWLIPHFEKMLYDNALLAIAYLEAYQLTQKESYRHIVCQTLDFVLTELTDAQGGFWCALDADSEGEEGGYYVFDADEIVALLGEKDGAYFNHYFGVTKTGNFEGRNILNRLGKTDSFAEPIEPLRQKVYDYRAKRMKLHCDDKILTAWSSLMTVAMAKAYGILGEERYGEAAKKSLQFIQTHLTYADGSLAVRYRDGEQIGEGFLDDYAYLSWALLSLYENTFQLTYLQQAEKITQLMCQKFADEINGGFFFNEKDNHALIYHPKEWYDGALPCGNSVAALILVKLAHLTGKNQWQQWADKQLQAAANQQTSPLGRSFYLVALMQRLYPTQELVAVIDEHDIIPLKQYLSSKFRPQLNVLIKTANNSQALAHLAPFTADFKRNGYYLCQNQTCRQPISTLDELSKVLF